MKKIGVLFTVIIMAVLFAVSASALEPSGSLGDNVTYTYNSTTGEVVISGNGAMKNYSNDGSPFYNSDIKSVVIENGVTSIGNSAFYYCDSLTSITIPASVTSIGSEAFCSCSKLTSITVDENNENYSSDSNGVLFNKDKTELVRYPEGITSTTYTIPDSVTSIGIQAFYNCDNLTSITIPDGVTSIGDSAFKYCSSFTSITIPDSVTSIGDSAFDSCYSLTNITIPDSVTSIGYCAFYSCDSLTNITIPDSVTSIGTCAFYCCDSLTNITIPDSVTSIGYCAFSCCTSLTNITVDTNNKYYSSDSNGVLFDKNKTELIQYPAGNTSSSYVIPDGVTSIGDYAFSHCRSLTSITIPNSVTSIGYEAFCYCTSLTSITIPNSVISIGAHAFYSCLNLTSITIPEGVTSIGFWAFYNCRSLTSITIPDSVTSIGYSAFSYCTSLTNITVDTNNKYYSSDSNGVLFDKNKTELIQYPAGNTSSSYVIPDGVTSIGSGAFYYCKALEDVYYLGTETQWNNIYIDSYNESLTGARIHYSSTSLNHYSATTSLPTCTEKGYTTYTCQCGYSYNADYVKENGHSYTSEITTEPTHLKEGVRTHTCSICGDTYPEIIAKTPEHTYKAAETVSAKCESSGYTVYVCECGQRNYDYNDPAKGHNYNGFVCVDCGETKMDNCSCKCHKGGITGFFWKISNFFNKLFKVKSKQFCACGVDHY